MAKIGQGKIRDIGGSAHVMIPANIWNDKTNAFKIGDEPVIKLKKNKIEIEKE